MELFFPIDEDIPELKDWHNPAIIIRDNNIFLVMIKYTGCHDSVHLGETDLMTRKEWSTGLGELFGDPYVSYEV